MAKLTHSDINELRKIVESGFKADYPINPKTGRPAGVTEADRLKIVEMRLQTMLEFGDVTKSVIFPEDVILKE